MHSLYSFLSTMLKIMTSSILTLLCMFTSHFLCVISNIHSSIKDIIKYKIVTWITMTICWKLTSQTLALCRSNLKFNCFFRNTDTVQTNILFHLPQLKHVVFTLLFWKALIKTILLIYFQLLGHLLIVARKVAKHLSLDNGFRIIINDGSDGGQEVMHIHVHLLGGRKMKWPPG